MKVINLFAEPSAGKSTTAAGLFFLMKHKGYEVELIEEYAKQCVWQNRRHTLNDQLYITAKQNHKLEVLRGKVDFVITDSPLLLGLVYSRHTKRLASFPQLVKEAFDSYDNLNILLTRAKPYKQMGRIQTEQEAQVVRAQLIEVLEDLKVPLHRMDGDNNAPEKILGLLNP
jgi:hypothetical protein